MNYMDKIKDIENKIKNLKNKHSDIVHWIVEWMLNSMVAVNVSIELITGIALGVVLGLIADNYLQTKPIMLIIFFIVGTLVGFYNMYKCLKKYGYFK